MSGIYNFNFDSEKVRWLKTAFKPHANAMLDRWQEQDRKTMGVEKAKVKRQELTRLAREN